MLAFNFRSPGHIQSSRLQRLLQSWNAARGDESLPEQGKLTREKFGEDFDILSHIEVYNAYYKPRFRVIEQGRALGEMYGAECPGHFIDEVLPAKLQAAALESYFKALEKKTPIYTLWELRDRDGSPVTEERLLLPFGQPILGVTEIWLAVETVSASPAFALENLRTAVAPPHEIVKIAIDPDLNVGAQ